MNGLALADPRAERSLRSSFACAWAGLRYAYQTQRNVRVHVAAAAAVVSLGILLRISALEVAVLIGAAAVVLATELLNTVAEALVDLVTAEYHPLAKTAKDVAAGAVLTAAAGAAAIGAVVFAPHLWRTLLILLG